MRAPYEIRRDDPGHPLVATAIHAGHDLRPEIAGLMALDEDVRLREEDPFTDGWTEIARNRVTVHRSRFEVDLNRSPSDAVCCVPEECWDLQVWRTTVPEPTLGETKLIHESFYSELDELLTTLADECGAFVLYDIHSYNHRRGELTRPADPTENPEINVGTGYLDRERWGPVVDAFIESLRAYDFRGRSLDVRENVKFRGGYLSEWTDSRFPDTGCALAIEVKKFFMDEHTGELDELVWKEIREAFASTVPPVLDALGAGSGQ